MIKNAEGKINGNPTYRLDKKASDKLNKICNEVGLTKTKTVEKTIEKFYDEYKNTSKV